MQTRLCSRNFLFLLLGQAFSLLGNYTLKFALSLYVLDETGSAGIFGTILAVAVVPTVLLSPFGGILADRCNRRTLMVALDALSGVAVLGTALLLGLGEGLMAITVLQIVLGILSAFESPTVQACIPQMHTGENLLKANALVNQIQAVAGLVTPFLGSLAYGAWGIGPVLGIACTCFFLTALLELGIRLAPPAVGEHQRIWQMVRADLGESMRFLGREQPAVLRLLLLAAGINFFASGCITVGLPYLVRTVLGLSAGWYGAAESILGAAAILGGVLVTVAAGRLTLEAMWKLLAVFGAGLLPIAVVFLVPSPAGMQFAVLLAALAVGQLTCSMFSVMGLCAIQQRTPVQLTGKVMAFVLTLSMAAQPVGQALYGWGWDRLPPWSVLLVSGGAVLAIAWRSRSLFRALVKTA